MGEALGDVEAAEQQQSELTSAGALAGSPAATGAGLHALDGECALCGSGSEAEPLGWVVSKLYCVFPCYYTSAIFSGHMPHECMVREQHCSITLLS